MPQLILPINIIITAYCNFIKIDHFIILIFNYHKEKMKSLSFCLTERLNLSGKMVSFGAPELQTENTSFL